MGEATTGAKHKMLRIIAKRTNTNLRLQDSWSSIYTTVSNKKGCRQKWNTKAPHSMADTALSHKGRPLPCCISLHTHMAESSAALGLVVIGTARFHHTSATRRANDHYAQSRAGHITLAENRRETRLNICHLSFKISWGLTCVTKSAFICRRKWLKKLISPSRCNIKY